MNHWNPFTKKRFRWIILLLMIPLLASSRGNPNSFLKPIEDLPYKGDFSLAAPIIEDSWINTMSDKIDKSGITEVPVIDSEPGSAIDDAIGMFSPSQRTWYLKWSNTDGWTGLSTVRFGSADTSLVPVVGDWDYNGSDTIGLYSPSQKTWYLKNANDDGWSNVTTVRFGSTDTSWVPVVGDWPGLGAPSCYELNRAYVGIGSWPTASPTKSAGCPDGEYVSGEAITMTPHIGAGWTFDYWAGTSCPSCSSFNMPSGHHKVTAYYKRLPHNIRVYNDLHDDWWSGIDWGKNNQILWVRIGATCAELFPDDGGTELLYAGEMTTDGNDTLRITPAYMASTSYQEFDITGVPQDTDGSYCVYLKTGWWEYLGAPSYVYQKNAANVLKCDGSCCTKKEAVIKITEPFEDTEIIFASDILPYTWWYESPLCSP